MVFDVWQDEVNGFDEIYTPIMRRSKVPVHMYGLYDGIVVWYSTVSLELYSIVQFY